MKMHVDIKAGTIHVEGLTAPQLDRIAGFVLKECEQFRIDASKPSGPESHPADESPAKKKICPFCMASNDEFEIECWACDFSIEQVDAK